MISQSVAWGYVIIIVLMIGLCFLLEGVIKDKEWENRSLRRQLRLYERQVEKYEQLKKSYCYECDVLKAELEHIKAELKIAQEIIKKAS